MIGLNVFEVATNWEVICRYFQSLKVWPRSAYLFNHCSVPYVKKIGTGCYGWWCPLAKLVGNSSNYGLLWLYLWIHQPTYPSTNLYDRFEAHPHMQTVGPTPMLYSVPHDDPVAKNSLLSSELPESENRPYPKPLAFLTRKTDSFYPKLHSRTSILLNLWGICFHTLNLGGVLNWRYPKIVGLCEKIPVKRMI